MKRRTNWLLGSLGGGPIVRPPYVWHEVRPAGDTNMYWGEIACSHSGQVVVCGTHGAAGAGGRLYLSVDYGETWVEKQPSGAVNRYWSCIGVSSDGTRIIVGDETYASACLYTSDNTLTTWTLRDPVPGDTGVNSETFHRAAISDNGQYCLVQLYREPFASRGYKLYQSSDFGATWTLRLNYGSTNYAKGVFGTPTLEKSWALFYNQNTQRSLNYGASYSLYPLAFQKLWGGGWASDDLTKIATGEYNGRVWLSTNSGASFLPISIGGFSDGYFNDVKVSGDGTVVIAYTFEASGSVRGVWTSLDGGLTFNQETAIPTTPRNDGCVNYDGSIAFAMFRNGRLYKGVWA